MALTKFTANVAVIAQLDDAPALTPAELKDKFDEASKKIQEYINNTLLSELDETITKMDLVVQDIPEVINSLESDDTSAALSAAQGKALSESKQNKILSGTEAPTGGNDGDIYLQY